MATESVVPCERSAGVGRIEMKNVLQARDRRNLVDRLHTLTPASERRWGRMSAQQMVCHLADVCRLSLGERRATPVGNVLAHTVIKALLLYTPAPIPKGVPSAPELDQTQGGTKPSDFATDVRILERLLERFAAGEGAAEAEHPFFGVLTRRQWGRFQQRHMDHHLRQFGA